MKNKINGQLEQARSVDARVLLQRCLQDAGVMPMTQNQEDVILFIFTPMVKELVRKEIQIQTSRG